MPIEICKLCGLRRELKASHLMPRSLYKKARSSAVKGNRDPLLITRTTRKTSSYQITDYVLCGDCEHRLNTQGEDYVMRLVAKQNGDFSLLEVLQGTAPTIRHSDWNAYSAADTPTIDRDKIAYFAISVYWRASIHTWEQENGDEVRIDLGTKYNEEIRKYLLGETPVPKNVSLQLTVCSDLLNRMAFFAPEENQKHKDKTFIFLARGMLFFFRASNTLTDFQKRLSIVNTAERWITIRDCGHG